MSDNEAPLTPPTTPSGTAPSYKIVDHTYDVVVVGAGGSGRRFAALLVLNLSAFAGAAFGLLCLIRIGAGA